VRNSRFVIVGVALLALLGGLWFRSYNQENKLAKNSLEAGYQRALFNMVNHVQNLDSLLAKGQVSQDNGQAVLTLASAWHEAESARSSLGQLPFSRFNLTSTQKYLAQTGDYAYALARKLSLGQSLSEEERENLATLSKQANSLNRELQAMIGGIKDKPNWGTKGVTVGLKGKPVPPAGSVADGLSKVDVRLQDEAPTLTYDGPFSEHMSNIKPRGVTGEPVTVEQAGRIAEQFINQGSQVKYSAKSSRRVAGRIPVYSITLQPQGGRRLPEIVVDVTQTGGHVISMLNPRSPKESKFGIKEAVEKAEEFARAKGYKDMISTGSLRHPNTLVVTLAWTQDDVVVYPDFVKVSVALDNGEVLAFDARGYLTSHQKRTLPRPKFTSGQAKAQGEARMQVERVRPTVIPMADASERYCWEVRGTSNGQTFLVYYNTENGREEKILQAIESEDGTYTM
jgi:spore germination protein